MYGDRSDMSARSVQRQASRPASLHRLRLPASLAELVGESSAAAASAIEVLLRLRPVVRRQPASAEQLLPSDALERE